jgi:ABC-type nitrate/sulfonate/bicarbonate transport system permease component
VKAQLARLGVVALLFVLWEGFVRTGIVSKTFLVGPSDIFKAIPPLVAAGDLLPALGTTALELLLGTLISIPTGVLVGFTVAESPALQRSVAPVLYLWTAIPKSLFLPLFVLALGVGVDQKVVFAVFQAFFVIAVATIAAVRGVPPGLLLVGRALRASRRQTYLKIYLPYTLPAILQGVRLGVIFAASGVLFSEMLVSRVGLGRLIAIWGTGYQLANLLAGVLMAGAGAIALNEILRAVELRLSRWRA